MDSVLIRMVIHTAIARSFGEAQVKLVEMISDNVIARYFVRINVSSRAPQRFNNHVMMRLTEGVETFFNPFDHRFYKVDRRRRRPPQ
jgi:hypothetical protein